MSSFKATSIIVFLAVQEVVLRSHHHFMAHVILVLVVKGTWYSFHVLKVIS